MSMSETSRAANPRHNRVAARRAFRWSILIYAVLALCGLSLAVWLLWGFRWPPTAAVVSRLGAVPIASDCTRGLPA